MRRLLRLLVPGLGQPATRYAPVSGHPVQVQVVGRNSLDILNARDVSISGIGVFVHHGFEGCDIDADVDLVISLPNQRPFMARGRVRHATDRGDGTPFFGLHFTELSKQQRSRLQAYLESDLAKRIGRADAA